MCEKLPKRPALKPVGWRVPWGSAVFLSLCLGVAAHGQERLAPPANIRDALYQRTTNQFISAEFFKPAEPKLPDLTFSLAPMLLQEVQGTNSPAPAGDQFGLLTRSNGVLTVDTSRPTIYVTTDTLQWKHKPYARLVYLWVYPDLTLQGVRITLDASGQPCLWEVMTDGSGSELFFVTQRLETAVRTTGAKPLPGRRYAVERRLREAPRTVVARVLDDAPAVMGPMVYLKAATHEVSTLICRCMPAQAHRLASVRTYTLVPFSVPTAEPLFQEAKARSRTPPSFWPGDDLEGLRLEGSLRLPESF